MPVVSWATPAMQALAQLVPAALAAQEAVLAAVFAVLLLAVQALVTALAAHEAKPRGIPRHC